MQTCPPGRRLDNQLRVDLYTSMQTNLKPLDRRQNTAAQAYAQLRAWIISGELRPGQVISEPKMAMTFGVSRTPIREVFKRLQDEQLLDIFPQQGTVVSPIDIALVRSNQFIRETLELRTIALAATLADVQDIAGLHAQMEAQKQLVREGNHRRFFAADDHFHETLIGIAGQPAVWKTIEDAKAQIDRVRHLSLEDPDWLRRIYTEHLAITDAIACHDAAEAVEAMQSHLHTVYVAIDKIALAHPHFLKKDQRTESPAF
ncbi:MAG: GntR family transcriptional regulator [Rhizobiales bacterium]|nr:GntR family transcriptional regulator [Hyphomicrobiales bacterium]